MGGYLIFKKHIQKKKTRVNKEEFKNEKVYENNVDWTERKKKWLYNEKNKRVFDENVTYFFIMNIFRNNQ